MRARSFALLVPLLTLSALAPACSQTPTVVPLRSMERPRDVDFVCLEAKSDGSWAGASLENCAVNPDGSSTKGGAFRLHAVVTQVSRGELAVVDLGTTPSDSTTLLKVDPRVPGYSFIPTVATPVDVVADPAGSAVFVASGRDPRVDVIPAGLLRGPIDTGAASKDPPPWPHIDFDLVNDGIPGAMAVVREGDARRLYVTLPEAKGGAKIAVYSLPALDDRGVVTGILPSFVGFISLTAGAAAPVPAQPLRCGTSSAAPWWWAYDVCKIPSHSRQSTLDRLADNFREPAQPETKATHLAGMASAAGMLFVADDRAPFVHVFDVHGNPGIEMGRLSLGSATSRVSISPVVPDEVTVANARAIDECYVRGWLGDGLDHSADSAAVKAQLGGRCRAHRYLYAIDLVNAEAGNGSIAIVDLPVFYAKPGDLTTEAIDLAGAEVVQAMGCDAPTFPRRRLPIGPFAVNAANTVPARAIAFVQNDPPPPSGTFVPQARCRPYAPTADELSGIPADQRAARIAAGEAWRANIDPSRMRGVYAWVALDNGAVVAVEIDDYDSLCRGPKDPAFADVGRTDEFYPRPVQRHHVRSLRLFQGDPMTPQVGAVVLSRFDNVLSNDPANPNGQKYPHFAALEQSTTADRPPVVLYAPDNPFAIVSETWTATFEGALPGFSGAFGSFQQEGANVTLTPSPSTSTSISTSTDSAVGFCGRGVDTRGPVEVHDVVQLTDPVCPFDETTGNPSCPLPGQKDDCLARFGPSDAQPLFKERSFIIEKAYDQKLVLANKVFKRLDEVGENYALVDGTPNLAKVRECFGEGLLRYTVRANGAAPGAAPWVVIGSSTGYTHRWKIDPKSGTQRACILDTTKPRILDARASELPPATNLTAQNPLNESANIVTDTCSRFVNVSWQFAIRRGLAASQQDMKFSFAGRFSWQPLSIGAGSLAASMRPVSGWWDGTDHLNWSMLAVIDAIDRGLFMFPANSPFSFQKAVN